MTVIAMSIAVMLARSAPRPASSGAGGSLDLDSPSLALVVDGEPDTSPSFVAHVVDEAAGIWARLGVRLTRGRDVVADGDGTPARVRLPSVLVLLTDGPAPPNLGHVPLGWIQFPEQGAEATIYLSRTAARLLLSSAPAVRHEPVEWQQVLLARVLGRALAHEVGHHLLQSGAHTPRGLMRPQWPLALLIANSRAPFSLERTEQARAAANLATGVRARERAARTPGARTVAAVVDERSARSTRAREA